MEGFHYYSSHFTGSMLFNRASLVFSLQNWLAETPEQSRKVGTPAYVGVGMAGKI